MRKYFIDKLFECVDKIYLHDVAGPSPPRRDDPMISGPLSSLPPDLESRLAAARQKTPLSSSGYSSAR